MRMTSKGAGLAEDVVVVPFLAGSGWDVGERGECEWESVVPLPLPLVEEVEAELVCWIFSMEVRTAATASLPLLAGVTS